MDLYLTAAGLGLSFGNLWICVLLVFSLQTTNRNTAAGYLAGRAAALMALCVLVALLGRAMHIPNSVLHGTAGVFLLGFASYLLAMHVFAWVPPWKHRTKHTGATDTAGADFASCDNQCDSCAMRNDPVAHAACGDCGDHGVCSAEEPEVRDLTVAARRSHSKDLANAGTSGDVGGLTNDASVGFWPGFVLGALRGAAMCSKLVVLLPLLLTADWQEALGVGVVFSVTSSIYPLLGFVFGRFALRLVSLKKPIFWLSSAFLIGLGARMLWMAFTH